jgi:hypothetical protein
MLGVVRYPYMPTDVDRVMRQVATEMGRGETFNQAPVGVYFGNPGVEADDPTSAGWVRGAQVASRAASATSAAGATRRTS